MTGATVGCPMDTGTYVILSSERLFQAAIGLIQTNVIRDPDGLLVSAGQQADQPIQSSTRGHLERLYNETVSTGPNENCDLLNATSQLGFFNSFMPHPLPLVLQVVVIVLTLLTNSITIAVFARPAMQNPTNTMLTGIAVTDLLTVLLPLPLILLRLGTQIMHDPVTMLKGYLVQYLSNILPTVCHTAAIWLTVLLAVQRTIYVQMPLQAVHCWLCQPKAAKLTVLFTCFLAGLSQLPGVLQTTYKYVITYCNSTEQSYLAPATSGITWARPQLIKCTHMPQQWYKGLLLLRVVTVNLIPCITLTLLTILLTWALHRFTTTRRRLLGRAQMTRGTTGLAPTSAVQTNGSREGGRGSCVSLTTRPGKERENAGGGGASNSEKDSTSIMLLVILIIFLVAELPTTVLICLAMHQINYTDQSGLKMGSEICNYIILLSYPANFFVYVSMSRPFRSNLSQLFPSCPPSTLCQDLQRRSRKAGRRRGDYVQANQVEDIEGTKNAASGVTAEVVGKTEVETLTCPAVAVEPRQT